MVNRLILLLSVVIVLLPLIPATAQDDAFPEPQKIEIPSTDGLILVGDYYAPPAPDAPSVILMHGNGQTRRSWHYMDIVQALLDAGYAVLAIDIRSHGETGGRGTWEQYQADTYAWSEWLRAQPDLNPDQVSLLGASLGAVLVIQGMAGDDRIVTAVALSPVDVSTLSLDLPAAMTTIDSRPIYLVASQRDYNAANTVEVLTTVSDADLMVRIYAGSAHGTSLFSPHPELIPSIIAWLDQCNER
jgi:alpha-beta hydrolase superfamily lysophospholipase